MSKESSSRIPFVLSLSKYARAAMPSTPPPYKRSSLALRLSPLLLLAAALVALAVLFAPDSQPASADHDEDTTILSATLTVAASGSHRGCGPNAGVACTSALTEVDFTYGGVSYQIKEVRVNSSGTLIFELNKTVPDNIKSTATLQLGSRTFAFASGGSVTNTVTNDRVTWTNSGLSWSAGDTVSVSLTAPPPTGVELSADSMSIGESGGGAFTVSLTADPGGETTVTLVRTHFYQSGYGESGHVWDLNAATVSPETLTFTSGSSGNWGTAQTVTVTGVEDDDSCDEQLVILVLGSTRKYDYVYVGSNNGTHNQSTSGEYVYVGSNMGEYSYQLADVPAPVGGSSNAVNGVFVTINDDDGGSCGGV